ncbi:hypothetical protein [Parvularcula dongshanensis]|uniref:SHS2 domain-containing protein n=1 Tax=Parvularcula dongshanensis TaxID=1173995 RepID=A0A840I6I7_9PROT|nr:hypothetical protein [Parvularcula dongshanensis]MBB4659863.1 hypothetical protein [Parvularcula dongshanensis]
MTHAVARLGRAGTAVLTCEAGRGGTLSILRHATSDRPSLTRQGGPSEAAGTVLRDLLTQAKAPGGLILVLPGGVAAPRRIEVNLPVGGLITHSVLDEGIGRARDAVATPGTAVLSCRPATYVLDGKTVPDAMGRKGRDLTLDLIALTAPIAILSAFDAAVRSAGARLDGVIPAEEAAAAAFLPSGEGVAIHLGYGDCVMVRATDDGLTAAARVPIGRRHLEQDVAQAFGMTDGAAARVDRVLSGRPDDEAEKVIAARLEELDDLLQEAATRAGVPTGTSAVISGLPANALRSWRGEASVPSAMPSELARDPLLAGGGFIVSGLRGSRDRAVAKLPTPNRPGLLDWLKERF